MISGVDKFLSSRPTFWVCNITCAPNRTRKKMGAQNKTVCPIEIQLEISLFVLYNLNSTRNFHF